MLPFQDQKIDWISPSHRRHHAQHSPATNHKKILSEHTTIHKINNTITNHQLLLLCILILFTALGFLLCVAIIKTDHPHFSLNPNGTLNATSEKIKTSQPWEYIHHYFQTDIQYTMKMNTTNLTQGNGTKLKEHNTEGKISGQKERAKKRARARARAKPQTVIYPCSFR